MKFKTNIMCGSCIEKVTPYLNKLAGENNWQVDTKDPKKILTITNPEVNENDVVQSLNDVGYKSELLS